ncbi:unnamed protein product [Fraxinus pennsylvanica]|uniref:Uncharacterized protein n=1 Tax=Fraxinus pennsylvanica TaxID=56036 RepID=A0AAD1Z6H6_9LAMI|nr:unnamed protein product [Fraxinus pennsylvanica]
MQDRVVPPCLCWPQRTTQREVVLFRLCWIAEEEERQMTDSEEEERQMTDFVIAVNFFLLFSCLKLYTMSKQNCPSSPLPQEQITAPAAKYEQNHHLQHHPFNLQSKMKSVDKFMIQMQSKTEASPPSTLYWWLLRVLLRYMPTSLQQRHRSYPPFQFMYCALCDVVFVPSSSHSCRFCVPQVIQVIHGIVKVHIIGQNIYKN